MKQSKTTLIIGVVLAIIAISIVVYEMNETTASIEANTPTAIEKSNVNPVARKTLSTIYKMVDLR